MSSKKERVLFILNPISGGRKRAGIEKVIEKELDTALYQPVLSYTSHPGNATELATQALAEGIKKIIAVGGDGTVNEVGRALVNTHGVLGIIPTGSGNGLARHLNIPIKVSKAISVINHSRVVSIDYGTINNQPFFCTAGLGFDALVGNMFAQLDSRGFTSYIKTVLKEYFSFKPERYELTFNHGKVEKEAFLITFANASQYGNNAYIAPEADIQDGLLDITILSPFPWYLAPQLGVMLFSKSINNSHYLEVYRTKNVQVKRLSDGYVHFDGEPSSMGSTLDIKIEPRGLNVIMP